MAITRTSFGTTASGEPVEKYCLENEQGMQVAILTYGGAIQSILVPDRTGAFSDVALGFSDMAGYEKQDAYIGALVGRHANRLERGKITINGKEYQLFCNDGKNHLHGGKIGFDKKVWRAEAKDNNILNLQLVSPDGDEGYPGTLTVTVTYELTEDNTLEISYQAETTKDTVVNLTNHCYFNLAGHNSGSILNHEVQIFADRFTENSAEGMPTGAISSVAGTPLDFRSLKRVGDEIDASHIQIQNCGGYDHNWILGEADGKMKKAVFVTDRQSGRCMEVETTMPGVQFYSGNFIQVEVPGKEGSVYQKRDGLCFETQYYPNAILHKEFPQPIVKAGDYYRHKTRYHFFIQ